MKRVAVFASGSGSNFETIVKAAQTEKIGYEVVFLFSDQEDAYALKRAQQLNVPSIAFSPKSFGDKAAYELELLNVLKRERIDFIVLAGYMRLIGPTLLNAYIGRIVNIHPSLLPSFPGKDAIQQALNKGVKVTGVTIHYVDAGMDTGPIIAQEAVKIEDTDTYLQLQKKIQAIEHELYPKTLAKLLREDEEIANETSIN
ncbi:phosphoribosylglycinamide formyltransferase [Bacillaceae bacterium W0354]